MMIKNKVKVKELPHNEKQTQALGYYQSQKEYLEIMRYKITRKLIGEK